MKLWLIALIITLLLIGILVTAAVLPPIKNREFVVGENDGGFFSRVIGMAAGAHYAKTHKAGAIRITNSDYLNQYTDKDENLMDAYFERKEFPLQEKPKAQDPFQRLITHLDPLIIGSKKSLPTRRRYGNHFWGEHREIFPVKSGVSLPEMSAAVHEFIHFKKELVDQADEWFETQVAPGPESYIVCVHYRGTDTTEHYPYKKSDPELYWKRMTEVLQDRADVRIFVATDDATFAKITKEKFPKCFLYDSPRSEKNDGLHKEGTFDVHELGNSVIIDALLLSKGHHLIKGRSNVSEYSLLRNPEAECTIIYTETEQWYKPAGAQALFMDL